MINAKHYQAMMACLFVTLSLAGYTTLASAADFKTVIPATASDILEAIDEETIELENIIKNNLFTEVHHHARVISELSNGLLAHAGDVSPQKLTQLKDDIKVANSMAENLDKSTASHDKAVIARNYDKLQKALAEIRQNYIG